MNPKGISKNSRDIMFRPKLTKQDVVEYVKDQFENLKNLPSMSNLVQFHTNNKYLLMAHNQAKLKELGNIVANHKKVPLADVIAMYEPLLISILDSTPTVKTHINVLMHIFGFFGKFFTQKEKEDFIQTIKNYREDKITLGQILSELEPLTYRFNAMYLVSQTYFLLYSEPNLGMIFSNQPDLKNMKNNRFF